MHVMEEQLPYCSFLFSRMACIARRNIIVQFPLSEQVFHAIQDAFQYGGISHLICLSPADAQAVVSMYLEYYALVYTDIISVGALPICKHVRTSNLESL